MLLSDFNTDGIRSYGNISTGKNIFAIICKNAFRKNQDISAAIASQRRFGQFQTKKTETRAKLEFFKEY